MESKSSNSKKNRLYKHESGQEKRKQAQKASIEKAGTDPMQKNIFQLLQNRKVTTW